MSGNAEIEEIPQTSTKQNEDRQLSWTTKKRLLQLEVPFPICTYAKNSKRNNIKQMRITSVDQYLKNLEGFENDQVICFDGMNGTGKSTLAANLNRKYCKINNYCPSITSNSDYNFYIMNALQYIIHRIIRDESDDEGPCIWDRDRYSNLRFYFVHYLMYEYRNSIIPMDDTERVYEKLNTLAMSTHLIETLTYFELLKPSPPTVILVCSDLHYLGDVLILRGGISDTVDSKNRNYQAAQFHVYNYFAEILKSPVVDIAYMFQEFNFSISDVQREIIKRVDYNFNNTMLPSSNDMHIDEKDQYETFVRLQNFCKNTNDQAVYIYSLK